MCKKLIYLISFVLVLGLADSASADLLVHWKLDEGSGTTVSDSSGNGNDGTFNSVPQWVDGKLGKALHFDGVDDFVIRSLPQAEIFTAFTVALWVKADTLGQPDHTSPFSGHTPNTAGFQIEVNGENPGQYNIVPSGLLFGTVTTDWVHLAVTSEGTSANLYYNGSWIRSGTLNDTIFNQFAISLNRNGNRWFAGIIDDFRVYDNALTEKEIVRAMIGIPLGLATGPYPGDGATDVRRDVVLNWTPGELADQHDVYFGTSFDDVNNATNLDPMGPDNVYRARQGVNSYAIGEALDFGQTYYWRIDEVNGSPDYTVYEGNIWQFTVEPVAYPMPSENITATASSSNSAGEGPENTINGSGLDADGLHSAINTDMWLSSMIGPQPTWIQYEFDRVYKLPRCTSGLVWNHNTRVEAAIGFGVKDATIEYSSDPDVHRDWTTLGTTYEFNQALGAAGYVANTTVDLSGVAAKYVKITANSNWGGFVPQFGLSEVRFFYVSVLAREPNPASGTTDMDVDNVTLSWRAGREAASHKVYFSDSNQAVIDGTALVATVSETSYDTGELQLNQNYYWKIVEVNEAETPTNWEGDVWNFTTSEFLVVEDFEGYNNFSPDRVFQTWIDGIGYSADEFFPVENPGNGSGAALGHDIWSYDSPHYDGDIMERSIVHGGAQSAPLYYDNTIAPFTSEIVRTFDFVQDWTKHGIKALTLYFYGDPNNVVQQMYVRLNNSKVVYDGEAANLTRAQWQPWNINLADFAGVDISNVTELSIGLESIGLVGGTGVVYFDDIRLYRPAPPVITISTMDSIVATGIVITLDLPIYGIEITPNGTMGLDPVIMFN